MVAISENGGHIKTFEHLDTVSQVCTNVPRCIWGRRWGVPLCYHRDVTFLGMIL